MQVKQENGLQRVLITNEESGQGRGQGRWVNGNNLGNLSR